MSEQYKIINGGKYILLQDHAAIIAKLEERIKSLKNIANEIDHVMNWDADHICKCFTVKAPGRNPNCAYHKVEELTRQIMLAEDDKERAGG
jgi:predicted metal-binding protein